MAKILLALAATAALITAATAQAAGVNAGSETVSRGPVTATLTWEQGDTNPQNTTLTIARGGATAFQQRIDRVCGAGCERLPADADGFQLTDLDGDGEPEVVVLDTNDGVCCETMGVFDFRPGAGTYGQLARDWAVPVDVEDIDGDGTTEIAGEDSRFTHLVPHHDGWYLPPQIFSYERPGGVPQLTDRTRDFPQKVRDDAKLAKLLITAVDRGDKDAGNFVAAYVADEFLLDHGQVGLREFDRAARSGILGSHRQAKTLRRRLLSALDRFGYR
jgi:hypothetical protein